MREKEDRRIASPTAAEEAERFVVACRETVFSEFPSLVEELFTKLEDALYDLSDKSQGDNPATAYLDAVRVFRHRRAEILARYVKNLVANEDRGSTARSTANSRTASSPADSLGTASRDEADLEETLAVANLISKAESRYRSELTLLRRHLASLGFGQGADEGSDPVGPYRLCTAFRRALRPVDDVELAIKLMIYKLFDKQVMDQLGGVYARCCESATRQSTLSHAGRRLPDPGTSEHGERIDANSVQADAAARLSGDRSAPGLEPSPSKGTTSFRDLQRLLGPHRHPGSGPDGEVVDRARLLSVLSRLRESAGSEARPASLHRRIGEALSLGLDRTPPRVLGGADADTLTLVSLLFEQLLQANEIPSPLKALIGRLEIPILRVALVDKSFFEDTQHPCRRLLNRLTRAATGWQDDGDRSPAGLYGRLEGAVNRIVPRDDLAPALWAELDAELRDLQGSESGAAGALEAGEPRTRGPSARGDGAEQLVRAAIDERLQEWDHVPDAVVSLLSEGWLQVLLAAFRRDGTAGPEWRKSMETVDLLVWSVQPKVAYEDKRDLLQRIPDLLHNLRRSLAGVAYDQRRLARWLKELQALHIMALRGTGQEPAKGGGRWQPAGRPAESRPDGIVEALAGGAGKGFYRGPAVLQAGAWIEVRRDDGDLARAKLSWSSRQSDLYLFVDFRGREVMELTGEDIRAMVQQGNLTVLGDTELVDRAMRELVRSLRSGTER